VQKGLQTPSVSRNCFRSSKALSKMPRFAPPSPSAASWSCSTGRLAGTSWLGREAKAGPFAASTNDSGEVVGLAVRLGERLRRDGVPLRKMRRDDYRASAVGSAATGPLESAKPRTAGESLEDGGPAQCHARTRYRSHPKRRTERSGLEPTSGPRSPRWTTRWNGLPKQERCSAQYAG